MHKVPKFAPWILMSVLAVVFAGVLFTRTTSAGNGLTVTGIVEAPEVQVAPEIGGRLVEVTVEEGQAVKAGDVLARLDTVALETQLAQAQAVLAAAEANARAASDNLSLLEAGPSDEQIAVAEAGVQQAQIALNAAQENYTDLSEAQQDLPNGIALRQQTERAQAALDVAQANLDLVKAGPRSEQIQAARDLVEAAAAQADAAAAAVKLLEIQLGKLTLTAPLDGVVLTRNFSVGELALPGSALMTLGEVDQLTIKVFVPEDRYGQIALGETLQVKTNSFANELFTGTVTRIADQAEFTPRNVQTSQSRKTTVYAVELRLDNAEGKLKPGMLADVVLP